MNKYIPEVTGEHKLVKKVDWRSTVVFSKVATFWLTFLLTFFGWIAALSFLPKGMGGVFVDFSGYNKEFSEFVY